MNFKIVFGSLVIIPINNMILIYVHRKYEEVYPPEVSEFVYITDDTYSKREVLRMEHLILKVLSFDLSTPTALAFLSHYCISNGLPKKMFHLAAVSASNFLRVLLFIISCN